MQKALMSKVSSNNGTDDSGSPQGPALSTWLLLDVLPRFQFCDAVSQRHLLDKSLDTSNDRVMYRSV